MDIQELIDAVRAWGIAKGITGPNGKGTLLGQLTKTQEELTETRDAVCMWGQYGPGTTGFGRIHDEIADGIGDCTVTLILAAEMAGIRFEDCLAAAYDEIKGRTGHMEDGVFIKDAPFARKPTPFQP